MTNLINVDANEDYRILKISEELKKDSNVIEFLQQNQMLPGNNIFISDANKYSITVSVIKNQYFGLDQFIAERVYVG